MRVSPSSKWLASPSPGADVPAASAPSPRALSAASRGFSGSIPTSRLSFAALILGILFRAEGALGSFARSSIRAPPSGVHCPLTQVWPVPPSVGVLGALPQRGGLRNADSRMRARINRHLDAILVCLNFLALGSPARAPVECFAGRPRSVEQTAICSRLRGSISAWFSDPPVGDTLFPKLDALVDSLHAAQAHNINDTLPPPVAAASSAFRNAVFMKGSSSFDPCPFLQPLSAACYLEPRLLTIPPLCRLHPALQREFWGHSFYDDAHVPQGLFQHGSDADLIPFLRQWDSKRKLLLLTPSETTRSTWGELFEVPKSDKATRVVFNRIPRSTIELHLAGASATIPSGFALER